MIKKIKGKPMVCYKSVVYFILINKMFFEIIGEKLMQLLKKQHLCFIEPNNAFHHNVLILLCGLKRSLA